MDALQLRVLALILKLLVSLLYHGSNGALLIREADEMCVLLEKKARERDNA